MFEHWQRVFFCKRVENHVCGLMLFSRHRSVFGPVGTYRTGDYLHVHTTVSVASVSLVWYSTFDILPMSVKAAAQVHSVLSVVQSRSNLHTMF